MKSALISTNSLHPFTPFGAHIFSKPKNPSVFCIKPITLPAILSLKSQSKPSRLVALCASHNASPSNAELKDRGVEEVPSEDFVEDENSQSRWNVEVGSPSVLPNVVPAAKLSLSDQAFFLLAFIACTNSVAFTRLINAAVPTLNPTPIQLQQSSPTQEESGHLSNCSNHHQPKKKADPMDL
ncbi:uncharacterized protein LOC132172754 isoform X2 [Corylus avellana]|uniref:uncharacterized protein LOC132172754 isoform X2 n=1 Tax=Corylus avellana TaxID=13451 RepID=UPI00286CCA0B|nr:uncharacterized protein LOC132172754 isoform X2 [Corylus avellana]